MGDIIARYTVYTVHVYTAHACEHVICIHISDIAYNTVLHLPIRCFSRSKVRRQKQEAVAREDYDRAMELKELEKQLENQRLILFEHLLNCWFEWQDLAFFILFRSFSYRSTVCLFSWFLWTMDEYLCYFSLSCGSLLWTGKPVRRQLEEVHATAAALRLLSDSTAEELSRSLQPALAELVTPELWQEVAKELKQA